MIVGGRIDQIEGKRQNENENMKGLNINITIEDLKADGDSLEIGYTYTATYNDNVGHLKIKGVLIAKEDKKLVKEIKQEWDKNKKLPDNYAESTLNVINYSGSANGTLIARVLNLSAPLIPPRIQLSAGK